jgi:dTDP-4-amino-4,6-dideoxygalactose transaminase
VHEAVVRSGGGLRVIDAGEDDFLMGLETLSAAQSGSHATVLCEVYGHTYDLGSHSRNALSPPVVRIVDMALSVPHPDLFRRLEANDFAVISFGAGKTMYAGWGGMGFTCNRALAQEVRKLRDSILVQDSFRLYWRRTTMICLRTIAHYPSVYSLARKLMLRLPAKGGTEPLLTGIPSGWSPSGMLTSEWRLPATRLDGGLALWNLNHAAFAHESRLALAGRYHKNLEGARGIHRPQTSKSALSHYTVRISPAIRNSVKERLYQAGIHTITLWGFHQHLDRNQFPNAFRLSSEVLNLPLSPWMSVGQVDQVCEVLIGCVEDCSREPA